MHEFADCHPFFGLFAPGATLRVGGVFHSPSVKFDSRGLKLLGMISYIMFYTIC